MKSEVVAILLAKKEEKLAAVAAEMDALIQQVEALEEAAPADVVLLQEKIVALEAKVAEQAELLAKSDALGKQLDALIPDAPVA